MELLGIIFLNSYFFETANNFDKRLNSGIKTKQNKTNMFPGTLRIVLMFMFGSYLFSRVSIQVGSLQPISLCSMHVVIRSD